MLVRNLLNVSKRTGASRSFHSSLNLNAKGITEATKVWGATIESIKEAKTYKKERIIVSPQSSSIRVQEANEPVLNFCANNYLGLSDNKELIEAAKKTLDSHGLGLSSVRFICGTQDIHKKLEKTIADFHKTEDTILYGSCFDANAGIFEALLEPQDAILSDSLNHASIIDGIRLAKAQKKVYKHLDMADLEQKLKETDARLKLIVTDGSFSMDGDIAPLNVICDLADKYNAMVMIDECHSTGFIGKTGRGTPELFGVEGRVDIINSTLGKALGGSSGGYTTGKKEAIELLRQKSRPYLFSNTIAPAIVGASLQCFDLLTKSTNLRDIVEENTRIFREGMKKAGFTLKGDPHHPIAPVMIGDAGKATEMANELLKKGIYVIGFSFPVVPKGEARIRVQLSAAHTPDQVRRAIAAFTEVGKQLNII
eukprot:TRINITY_DN4304_c0_g1_i1.p1 TRINITY_DN4304_c0_g1~~TRINITY_DN4304_c0_g1_i1.p1  ORF type:complete len:425 (+),score=109.53 TRINITY_DN4304_c0_g1_i1:49-1323(+)